EQRREVAQKFKAGGVTPLSCGVIYMKNETEAKNAFEYARDAGISTIVCNPEPDMIAGLDKMVKEYDMRLAIHNHGPESKYFRSPLDIWPAIEKYDKRIGLCIDIGHTLRVGVDPAESILKCRERLYDVHVKDISKADPKAGCIEGGRGVIDFKAVFQALLKIQYAGLIGIEYEKDGNDPLPGLSETIGYMKGVLATLPA
ncbi:MAG TPA: sugar phosphate isomerase/epimerase, partial [Tepidisphaeraceae bacterium]|nr:sugar phosphate isomerase/epimerase [Tepidisphaeraceae bacterium]